RADQQDIALAEFNFVFLAGGEAQTFVVVVHGNGQHFLGVLLADHVLIENIFDFVWRRQFVAIFVASVLLHFLTDDVVAEIHALVTNENGRASDQFANFVLAFATEGAVEKLAAVATAVLGVITHGCFTPLFGRRGNRA